MCQDLDGFLLPSLSPFRRHAHFLTYCEHNLLPTQSFNVSLMSLHGLVVLPPSLSEANSVPFLSTTHLGPGPIFSSSEVNPVLFLSTRHIGLKAIPSSSEANPVLFLSTSHLGLGAFPSSSEANLISHLSTSRLGLRAIPSFYEANLVPFLPTSYLVPFLMTIEPLGTYSCPYHGAQARLAPFFYTCLLREQLVFDAHLNFLLVQHGVTAFPVLTGITFLRTWSNQNQCPCRFLRGQ